MTYRLGRIHDHNPPRIPDLASYATKPLPAPAIAVAPPEETYNMDLNDSLGDCEIAEVDHLNQAFCAITGEPFAWPGEAAIRSTYFGLTGGQDTGLMTADVLSTWRGSGLFGHKIGAYAPVHFQNTQLLRQGVDWFGGVFCGVNLPAVAQTQFSNGQPWDLTGTSADDNIEGGHAVPIIGYDPTTWYVVTWGQIQQVTLRWWARYAQEAYALIPNEFEARGGDARGLSVATLQADLANL